MAFHILALFASAQLPPGMIDQLPKKPKPAPLDADVKYIECGTCKEMTSHLYNEVSKLVVAQAPETAKKRRLETRSNLGGLEEQVETLLTNTCNSDEPDGAWLRHYDIVKEGRALTLKRMGRGKCRRECKTVEKACARTMSVLEDHDLGEVLIEAAREKAGAAPLQKRVCTKIATCCKKGKVPLYPEGKVRKNELFWELSEQDVKTEQTIEDMKKMKGENGQQMMALNAGDIDMEGFDIGTPDDRDVLKDEL